MTFEIDPQQPLDFPAAFKALLNPKRANPFDITNAPDSVDASMSLTSVSRQENSRQTEATIANFQLSTKIGDSEFTRNFKSEGKAIAVQLDGGEDQLNAQLVSTDRAKTKLYLEITRKHVGPHNLGDLFRNEWSGTLSSKIPDDDKNDDNDKVVVLGTLKGFINTH